MPTATARSYRLRPDHQPAFVVAYMTEQLQLQKRHKALEIGTGSGYQAAILSGCAGMC